MDFGATVSGRLRRREYHKMNVVSENKNENVEIIVKATNNVREKNSKEAYYG